MRVTVLGSGGAIPTAQRSSSGYLVEWRGGALLLTHLGPDVEPALPSAEDGLRISL